MIRRQYISIVAFVMHCHPKRFCFSRVFWREVIVDNNKALDNEYFERAGTTVRAGKQMSVVNEDGEWTGEAQ
jgi:hypothetical protein